MADEFKGITQIIGMIPRGGKFAKSVVNFVHKAPQNWEKFKSAIQQIDDVLKQGKLRLDGKQKTIFESNKNILKNHEKVTTGVDRKGRPIKTLEELQPSLFKKEFPPFNVSKEDFTKGWKPTLYERSNLRNIYKELDPPPSKYTAEMEKIDEELDALVFGGDKYRNWSEVEKAKLFKKLQADMKKLIKVAKENDPTKLSLSQINKKNHAIQKRIREIADNPNIKGTVREGPKRDMIKVIADSERKPLENAQDIIRKQNAEKKYGTTFPRLDPENESFIIYGLDERGNPQKVSRFVGKFTATKDLKTGDLSRAEGTSFYDTWNSKTGKLRKKGEEVFHETLNSEGKVIMSNPEYTLPEIKNMELAKEFYSDLSTSALAKKGYDLKDIDKIVKGRKVREYLQKTENPDYNINMHEQTSTHEIGDIMDDLYYRGDDVYKMSIEEWVKKIPEYFAQGGHVPGFATGGVSNLFRQRQGYRDAGSVIKLAKGARWLIRMLKEMSDDMLYGRAQFAKMTEALKMKYFKETQSAIKHLESGGPIPENLLQTMRKDPRFQNLTVSKGGDKDFIEMQEVVLGSKSRQAQKLADDWDAEAWDRGRDVVDSLTGEKELIKRLNIGQKDAIKEFTKRKVADEKVELFAFMNELPKDLQHKIGLVPVDKQINLLRVMKRAYDAAKKGNIDKGVDVLQEQMLTDFIPKGKPHATGGLIQGYATGGVSNLFRSR